MLFTDLKKLQLHCVVDVKKAAQGRLQTVKKVVNFYDVSTKNVGATIGRPPNTGCLLEIFLFLHNITGYAFKKVGRFRATNGRPYEKTGSLFVFRHAEAAQGRLFLMS